MNHMTTVINMKLKAFIWPVWPQLSIWNEWHPYGHSNQYETSEIHMATVINITQIGFIWPQLPIWNDWYSYGQLSIWNEWPQLPVCNEWHPYDHNYQYEMNGSHMTTVISIVSRLWLNKVISYFIPAFQIKPGHVVRIYNWEILTNT